LSTDQYASGDVLADTQAITAAVRANGKGAELVSLVVLDKDDQGEALDILILKTNVSIGTENSAVSVSDANADEIQCVVEIAAGDFVDLVNSQIAQVSVNCLLEAPADSDDLYVAAISRGTGTYTASGITLKLGMLQD
jgi:hypothetical protein